MTEKTNIATQTYEDYAVDRLEFLKGLVADIKAEIKDLYEVEKSYDFLSDDKRETFGVCASRLEILLHKYECSKCSKQ